MGYEVFYSITIELSKNSARILSVESVPKLALFNGMPIMREYLKNAHLINQPVLEDGLLPPEEFLGAYIP